MRAWRLTADGEAVIDAHRSLKRAQRTAGRGGSSRRRAAAGAKFTEASPGAVERRREGSGRPFADDVLTHEVLAAVASLSGQETAARATARSRGPPV